MDYWMTNYTQAMSSEPIERNRNSIEYYPECSRSINRTQSNAKLQSNAIEYYPEIGRSIAIRLRSTIESQIFDCVWLTSSTAIIICILAMYEKLNVMYIKLNECKLWFFLMFCRTFKTLEQKTNLPWSALISNGTIK